MTEEEWLTCVDPMPMLGFLRGKASDRKLRLFAVACCRRIWHLLTDERSRKAVEVAEGFAYGMNTRSELLQSWAGAEAVVDPWASTDEAQEHPSWRQTRMETHAGYLVACASDPDVRFAGVYDIIRVSSSEERNHQSTTFRDIFGNPFRTVAFNPAWRSPKVVALAQAIYDERAFDRLPTLADELEKAGCDDAEILAHCHQPGPHVRGCWALDLVLGKD